MSPRPGASVRASIVLLVLAACGGGSKTILVPKKSPPAPLVTIEVRRTGCPEGDCKSFMVMRTDGAVAFDTVDGDAVYQVETGKLADLAAEIAATDFAAFRAEKPFQGTCPTEANGIEEITTFYVDGRTERISSCEVELGYASPLFDTLWYAREAMFVPGVAPPTDTGPLVRIYGHGGMCSDGECESQQIIHRDGSLTYGDDDAVPSLIVPPGPLTVLLAEIEAADYEAIRARPYNRMCPTAWDGSELIYTFYTAHGEEKIAGCEFVFDESQRLFEALRVAQAAMEYPPAP